LDICDRLGLCNQTAEPGIVQLCGRGTLIGWARTALALPVSAPPRRHYGNEIDFIDSLRRGDVAVIDCSRRPVAAWGELFSAASKGRGARGAIIDGMIRDRSKIEAPAFAVFARGCRPTDSLGRVSIEETDLPIALAGMPVRSGDLVVADADGITIVPRERAEETVRLGVEKAMTEDNARDLLPGVAR
jgi:4-hydroxy-4-methyl-2-oxoglutarate aldolase